MAVKLLTPKKLAEINLTVGGKKFSHPSQDTNIYQFDFVVEAEICFEPGKDNCCHAMEHSANVYAKSRKNALPQFKKIVKDEHEVCEDYYRNLYPDATDIHLTIYQKVAVSASVCKK